MIGWFELALVLAGLLVAFYYYSMSSFDYWESRGVNGPKPIFFFGNVKDTMTNKRSFTEILAAIYHEYKNEPLVGVFVRHEPMLMVNDLDFIKDVMIKDFSKFASRGINQFDDIDSLSAHLFNIDAKRWRPLRLHLSPVFTSGKLKQMFYLLTECADHLEKCLEAKVKATKGNELITEVREMSAKFTTDVIGSCAFGLQMNAMDSENSIFREMGKRIFATHWKNILSFRLKRMAPRLYRFLGWWLVNRELNDFYVDLTRQTMDYRKESGVVKHDFVDLLKELRDHPEKIKDIELTDELLAAQLFVFFVAGFETSSSTMTNALYELALNQEIQDKLRDEINEEWRRAGGKIEYEGIKNMRYLDMVFQETLRKYPIVPLIRESLEDYTFETREGKKIKIEKNTKIWIPAFGIQRDPQYYPNPEVFDPERFTPEAIKERNPMTYSPFGDGPRNCIGKRFGVMQTKVGLFKILNHFKVEPCEKTPTCYTIEPRNFLLTAKDGIWLKIVKIDNTKIATA